MDGERAALERQRAQKAMAELDELLANPRAYSATPPHDLPNACTTFMAADRQRAHATCRGTEEIDGVTVDWDRAMLDNEYFWEVASPAVLAKDARLHPEWYTDSNVRQLQPPVRMGWIERLWRTVFRR